MKLRHKTYADNVIDNMLMKVIASATMAILLMKNGCTV